MNKVIINPKNYEQEYLSYLNTCFPNWGNETNFDWVFRRNCGKKTTDFLILENDENQVIAGSAITYRKLKLADESLIDIGIMTGSWTLPKARGKGCFSQIIEESKMICKHNNVDFLTAFVTDINASYRRLTDADFFEINAVNFFSNDIPFQTITKNFEIVTSSHFSAEFWFEAYKKSNVNKLSFVYQKSAFEGQYLNRINPSQAVLINQTHFLFEENDSIVKLLLMNIFEVENLKFFCNWILETKNKKVMFFTSNTKEIEILKTTNFSFVNGFLMVQNTNSTAEKFKNLHINLGDKM